MAPLKYMLLGVFFLIVQIIFGFIFFRGPDTFNTILSVCHHIPLLFAIGFFLKKDQFIKGLIHIGLIGQVLWIIDYMSFIFTGSHIWGFTDYMQNITSIVYIIMILIVHFLSTFLALGFVYKIKPERKSIIYSVVYGMILYIIILLFTRPERNVNCVFEFCP
ncbi:MAG: hypothetical protein ACMXYK_04660 [Candidatus Woesearchaeota archaeon]